MEVHFADIGLVKRTPDGRFYTNDQAPGITYKDAMHFTQDWRVLPNTNLPNTIGYPTIAEYLSLEATYLFKPVQVTQTFIITQKEPDIFSDIGQVIEKVNILGNVSGNQVIDLTLGNVVTATLTGPGTWTIQNQAASGMSSSVKFYLTNAGVNITWAVVPQWVGNIPPIFSVAGTDILILSTVDGGVTWFGSVALGYP
jgi:hypothetical protein